jgi:hypothetical protein
MNEPQGTRADARPTVAGLAGRLRALREATHPRVSQTAAAKQIEAAQNKISRAENGEAVLTPAELRALGRLYGASREDILELEAWAKALKPGQVKAGTMLRRGGGTAAFQARISKMEEASRLVRAFQPGMVLGQLQTRRYATEVFGGESASITERMRRHARLLEDGRRRWQLVQPVGALLWNLGGAEVMAEQMDRLAEVTELPHVDLRIITERQPVNFTATHGFHLYDEQAVVVGILTGTTIDPDTASIRQYVEQFERLRAVSIGGDEARAVLIRLATAYREDSGVSPAPCRGG